MGLSRGTIIAYCFGFLNPLPYVSEGSMSLKQVRNTHSRRISIVASPVTVYPGGLAETTVHVGGHGVRVLISATPQYSCIQVLGITPVTGVAPLEVKVVVAASDSAKPGMYWVDVIAIDPGRGKALASARIPVFVLGSQALVAITRSIDELRRLYREKGIQYTIVRALSKIGAGLRFSDIKCLYELIAGRRVSNGSVGDLLRRLLKKGIVKHVGDRYYLIVDPDTAETLIDLKRARNGLRGVRVSLSRGLGKVYYEQGSHDITQPVERALKIVKKLVEEDYSMAVDLVAHVLVGVRRTGMWILWFEDYFIYCESKTNFLHYFRSPKLSSILRDVGLEPGLMLEHEQHLSEDYILELYGSYANARRIHYLLKQLGWFIYGEPLLLELSKDHVLVVDLTTDRILFKQGDSKTSEKQRAIIYPGEHIDEDNEETYFYRPSGLY